VAEPVNTDGALVTEYRRDNLTNCCGGNAIDIRVSQNWQPDAKKVATTPSGEDR